MKENKKTVWVLSAEWNYASSGQLSEIICAYADEKEAVLAYEKTVADRKIEFMESVGADEEDVNIEDTGFEWTADVNQFEEWHCVKLQEVELK